MEIHVYYDRENKEKTIELAGNSLVKNLLDKMKINPVTVIVSKDDTVVTEDEKLNDKDNIRLISVISGG
jgi:sulfur carrier protein ThiS|tara:strand:+ start:1672 stop:1878 length:207 start_codon:yes stop_codon:yes gene_type:complete